MDLLQPATRIASTMCLSTPPHQENHWVSILIRQLASPMRNASVLERFPSVSPPRYSRVKSTSSSLAKANLTPLLEEMATLVVPAATSITLSKTKTLLSMSLTSVPIFVPTRSNFMRVKLDGNPPTHWMSGHSTVHVDSTHTKVTSLHHGIK